MCDCYSVINPPFVLRVSALLIQGWHSCTVDQTIWGLIATIAYFGVWKCYVCSHLCNCMLNLVMQCCLLKYICWCSVDRAYMLCGQRKSHRTWTKQWNPSLMFSSITHSCIPAIVCSQHTRLVSSNRLCCYRSSDTFLIIEQFAAYHTHLVKLNRFCSLASTQTIHPSELYAVYCTHLHLAARFFCSSSSQIVNWAEPYALHLTRN